MLAREASHKTGLRLFAVRSPGNAVGAENVLAWRSGFPAAVSFARGEPRYDPSGGSGEVMLRRGDVDAALVVGSEPQHFLTAEALARLSRTPTVRLGPELSPGTEPPAVFIATAPAAATPGSLFRMDGIAVRRTPTPAEREAARDRPTEAAVLARIAAALEAPSGKARA
jgi:formylmethanofuran dehydrogenase subunit B